MRKIVNSLLVLTLLFCWTTDLSAVKDVLKPDGYFTYKQKKEMDMGSKLMQERRTATAESRERYEALKEQRISGAGNSTSIERNSDLGDDAFPLKVDPSATGGSNRFPSEIDYGEGNTGIGAFGFTDDSAAVWYRPLTDAYVTGLGMYFNDDTELIGTDVTLLITDILDDPEIDPNDPAAGDLVDITGNGVYDFTVYNEGVPQFKGDVLWSYTFPLTESDVYPNWFEVEIPQEDWVDVGARDFAITLGVPGGDNADLLYYAGINGSGIPYNHGIKWYHAGGNYCAPNPCWTPRLNFVISAYVDYYGDPPPFITNVEDLDDVYESCDPGPYDVTADIEDLGTAAFAGALTEVLFIYNDGSGNDTTDVTSQNDPTVGGTYTGTIPAIGEGGAVEYWWSATDNGDENPDGDVKHTTDLQFSPLSFAVHEASGANILLMNDTGSEDEYMSAAVEFLNAVGYLNDEWNTFTMGNPGACELGNYGSIIVGQGLNGTGAIVAESDVEAALMAHVDAGGNLAVISDDYIYGLGLPGEAWTSVVAGDNPFLANYLHVSDYCSDCNADSLYAGIDGTVSDGLGEFEAHPQWPDEVIADGDAVAAFMVWSEDDGDYVPIGGVQYEGTGKVVFIPWDMDWIGSWDLTDPDEPEWVSDDSTLEAFAANMMGWFAVEHTPVVSDVDGASGIIFSSDDQTIVATVDDEEGDAFTVDLVYTIGTDVVTDAMTDNGDGTFTAVIPGQAGGTTVQYYVVATDAGGSFVTATYEYFVYAPSTDLLFVLNNEMDASSYPGLYYLSDGVSDLWYLPDFWESTVNGLPTAELLAFYDNVIEITSTDDYPYLVAGAPLAVYHNTVVSDWLALGNKHYVLAGDETFGIAELSWDNVNYEAGSFFYEMGVDSSLNDINAGAVTPLLTVEGDLISGDLFAATGGDTVLYDPGYEIGLSNWLDGMIPTSDVVVSFTDTAGTAVGVHREWSNGNKTMLLGFDPLSLNDDPYVWWGVAQEGALYQALDWFGILGVVDMAGMLPKTFALHQNYPNPFNPVTNMQFDLPEKADVKLVIYNLMGQQVTTLVNSELEAGYHNVLWKGTDTFGRPVSSGLYIYRIIAGDYTSGRKMLLLK